MDSVFYWAHVCAFGGMASADEFDAWCAGPRTMDNHTEAALSS